MCARDKRTATENASAYVWSSRKTLKKTSEGGSSHPSPHPVRPRVKRSSLSKILLYEIFSWKGVPRSLQIRINPGTNVLKKNLICVWETSMLTDFHSTSKLAGLNMHLVDGETIKEGDLRIPRKDGDERSWWPASIRKRIALGWAAIGKEDNIIKSNKVSMKIQRKIHDEIHSNSNDVWMRDMGTEQHFDG